jgi:hypothetical protein
MIVPFSDEQARTLVNLEQAYRAWMEAEWRLAEIPYDMKRKQISGRSYLYEIHDRVGNGRSLGPWSPEQEARLNAYREDKRLNQAKRDGARERLAETARVARALRTPMLSTEAGEILRTADRQRLLGAVVLVVGTNAMPAYSLEAGGFIQDAPDETQDFDLAWSAEEQPDSQVIWKMLKAVDETYTVNMERPFQARNAKAYEVEVLAAPSRMATLAKRDRPRPVPLPEQEWLLQGRPVDRVVVCRDGSPARIVAPDPRWFALQKLWMSGQAKRNPLKRGKDQRQSVALLNTVHTAMPQYPLDAAFEAALPHELSPLYMEWKRTRPERPAAGW